MTTHVNNSVDLRTVANLQTFDAGESGRRGITTVVTCLMAAQLIAMTNFPNRKLLPKILPPPFNNLGHQLLMDYALFLVIVWEVVEDIKSCVERWKKKKRPWIYGGLAGAAASLALAVVLGSVTPSIPLLFGSLFVYVIGTRGHSNDMRREVGDIRADAIRRLMKGEWLPSNRKVTDHVAAYLEKVGDGALGGDYAPVITVLDNNQPFAGYGKLQAENLFICRPKEKEADLIPPMVEVRAAVARNVTDKVSGLGLKEVSFGEVVLIHADSLPANSAWLDDDDAPRLWIEKEKVASAYSLDPRVSTRSFLAAQVLLPDYMTLATFFVRVFRAGNSATCKIAVSTLGPPVVSTAYLRKRLLKHKLEREDGVWPAKEKKTKLSNSQAEQEALEQLRYIEQRGHDQTPFQPYVNTSALDRIKLEEELERRTAGYEEQYRETVEKSAMWPGRHYWLTHNWREINSYTFTPDFFGRTEAIASVKTIYDQIARAMLNTLDGLGYDVSDYRDKEGKYSINAEKIEQLVVGEMINFSKPDKADKSNKAGQVPPQVEARAE